MTGDDWVFIVGIAALVVLIFTLDGLRRLDDREADRVDRAASERRYRRERERLP